MSGVKVCVSWLDMTRILYSLFLAFFFRRFMGRAMSPVALAEGRGCLPVVVGTSTTSTRVGVVKAALKRAIEVVGAYTVAALVRDGMVEVILGEAVVTTTTFFRSGANCFLAVTIATTLPRFIERPPGKTNLGSGRSFLVKYL